MSKDKNECINCGGGLIITPAYPVAQRTIYCENCGKTPAQSRLDIKIVESEAARAKWIEVEND